MAKFLSKLLMKKVLNFMRNLKLAHILVLNVNVDVAQPGKVVGASNVKTTLVVHFLREYNMSA